MRHQTPRPLTTPGLARGETLALQWYVPRSLNKRERHLYLTEKGAALERALSDAQRARMRAAYRQAGPQAVQGFRTVLEAMMDPDLRRQFQGLKEGRE